MVFPLCLKHVHERYTCKCLGVREFLRHQSFLVEKRLPILTDYESKINKGLAASSITNAQPDMIALNDRLASCQQTHLILTRTTCSLVHTAYILIVMMSF